MELWTATTKQTRFFMYQNQRIPLFKPQSYVLSVSLRDGNRCLRADTLILPLANRSSILKVEAAVPSPTTMGSLRLVQAIQHNVKPYICKQQWHSEHSPAGDRVTLTEPFSVPWVFLNASYMHDQLLSI